MANSSPPYTLATHTASDGYCWRYRRYPHRGEEIPRADVVCIHGIQSHAGWYEYSCTRLSQAGFAVSFLDRRGAGSNEQNRGDTPGFRRLLDDIAEFLQTLRGETAALPSGSQLRSGFPTGEPGALVPGGPPGANAPGSPQGVLKPRLNKGLIPSRPLFLVAISWGGKLATALQRRHPGLVDGLALLCPGFFPKVRPSLKQRLSIAWSRLVAPRRLFPIPLNDPELFTATPRWQQFIRDDPLGLREATARFLVESVRLDGYLHFVQKHVQVPVLLLLAEHDRIINNAPTRRYVEGFASADKEIIEYPGAHHTLEFEEKPDGFIDDLQRWLQQHC